MKKIATALVLSFLSVSIFAGPRPGKVPEGFDPAKTEIRNLTAFTARGGLPNFYGKLKDKASEVRIAYFGGSITEQRGYRVFSMEYFKEKYPDTRFVEINAAIGGTATDLGVFRCRHDVLSESPDLVIIEFAVNDSFIAQVETLRNLEGIVRQIWKNNPRTDILFLYLCTIRNSDELLHDKMSPTASAMEALADYYDIPSIHCGSILSKLLKADILLMAGKEGMTKVSGDELNVPGEEMTVNASGEIPFSPDGVHPYLNTGHRLYMKCIREALPSMQASRPHKHRVFKPLLPDCRENVCEIKMDDPRIRISGPHSKDRQEGTISSPFLHRTDGFYTFEPGAEINFKFRGNLASMYYVRGYEAGSILVSVDGGKPERYILFDEWCHYSRLALSNLCKTQDPNAIHTVSIKVSGDDIDKPALLKGARSDFDKNPEKYLPRRFCISRIFLVGEMLQ